MQLARRAGHVEDEADQHGQEPAPVPAGPDPQAAKRRDTGTDPKPVDGARRKRSAARRTTTAGDRDAGRADRGGRQGDPAAGQAERDVPSVDDGAGRRATDRHEVRGDTRRREAIRDGARRSGVPGTDARRELQLDPDASHAPDQGGLAPDEVVAGPGRVDSAAMRVDASDMHLGETGRRTSRKTSRRRRTRSEARGDSLRDVAGRHDVQPEPGGRLARGGRQEPPASITSTSCPEPAIACPHGSQADSVDLNSVPTIATPSTDFQNCAIASANSRSRQLVTHTGRADSDEAEKDPRWGTSCLTPVPLHSRGRGARAVRRLRAE